MSTVSFQIDEQLNSKLKTFAKLQERSKGYIMRKAIEAYLEDQADFKIGSETLEEFYKDNSKTFSLEEVKRENGL
jgi:RHH-type transcriptional regulator, rel operon repressor / antitoxin RelB